MSPIRVAAGLVFHQGRLLIAQRPPGGHLAGLWEFPGGKLESGETWEGCLRRELREELGILVEVGELFEDVTHAYPAKTVHLRFFRCSWRDGEVQALGCADFHWATREDLQRYPFPPADTRLLARLNEPGTSWW